MPTPTFAIVTPSLNHGRFIEETIRSIVLQGGDFRIDYAVVDGGSTDNTTEVLKRYTDLVGESRLPVACAGVAFRWISERDRGMYDAINKGFRLVDGAYLTWLNSDDLLTPWALRTVQRLFERFDEVEWLTGRHGYVNQDGTLYQSLPPFAYSQHLLQQGCYEGRRLFFVQQEGTFWRRALWHKVGGRVDDELKLAGDFELWMRMAEHAALASVDVELAGFRSAARQASSDKAGYYREVDALLARQGKDSAKVLAAHGLERSAGGLVRRAGRRLRKHVGPRRKRLTGICLRFDPAADAWVKVEAEI